MTDIWRMDVEQYIKQKLTKLDSERINRNMLFSRERKLQKNILKRLYCSYESETPGVILTTKQSEQKFSKIFNTQASTFLLADLTTENSGNSKLKKKK